MGIGGWGLDNADPHPPIPNTRTQMSLEEKLSNLPTQPGCYLFRDKKSKIIYVGKAKNLRNRVRQYFHTDRAHVFKTGDLIARIHDVDLIVTDNEIEALALESNLIKKHKPIFNVLLKDDKQYPHIKITNEGAPRAMIARKILKDGASYYGPFLPISLAWNTLDLINKNFQLRTCTMEIDGKADRPCLRVPHQTMSWPVRQPALFDRAIQRGRSRCRFVAAREDRGS